MLSAFSPAKINLFLNVVGKRNDGYHLLESLFIPLKLVDKLSVHLSETLEVKLKYNKRLVSNKKIDDNIVLRVAEKLKDEFNVTSGAKFIIKKNIPLSAGLGGGSSNAAVALDLLCKLWQIDLSYKEKVDFLTPLGADIPFFIKKVPAIIKGIGEKVFPIIVNKKLFMLLVNPNFAISTEEVYKMGFQNYSVKLKHKSPRYIGNLILDGKNDLEANAKKIKPPLTKLLNEIKLKSGCLVARLSGSGATCFGLFEDEEKLESAYKYFEKLNFWVYSEIIDI